MALTKQDEIKEHIDEKERLKKTETNEEKRNKMLKKILPKTKKRKTYKKMIGETDKDKDDIPVKTENMDTPDKDDMLPIGHQLDYRGVIVFLIIKLKI